jgi:hypothetical protein
MFIKRKAKGEGMAKMEEGRVVGGGGAGLPERSTRRAPYAHTRPLCFTASIPYPTSAQKNQTRAHRISILKAVLKEKGKGMLGGGSYSYIEYEDGSVVATHQNGINIKFKSIKDATSELKK